MTCGGVDHGKSTLLGRLLFDSRSVPEDHLALAKRDNDLDFSMLLDGLRAEREQGITIDVAYRYFRTNKRKFIIADAPGHEQYTRNMATAASNCDLAVVLVDAREGIIEQTRRHSFIAALLGIKHLVIAVNKMDLVDRSEERFDEIRRAYNAFAARLEVTDVEFIPMVASTGENVALRSPLMEWYGGRPLLDHLENVHIASDRNLIDLRFPVQLILRGDDGSRHIAGTIASGVVRVGDEVSVLPSQTTARVSRVSTGTEAFAPLAVAVTLDRDVDVSRGDMLAHIHNIPTLGRDIEAMLVWMGAEPLRRGREYLLQHCANQVPAVVHEVRYRIDMTELRRHPADELQVNEIGRVHLEAARRIAFDTYGRNRATGAFIVIDRMSGDTVGAGMIVSRETAAEEPATPRRSFAAIERLLADYGLDADAIGEITAKIASLLGSSHDG
ncbi:MAG TPA: GTP-binding protein [Thermoanaerobaculia bacterium]